MRKMISISAVNDAFVAAAPTIVTLVSFLLISVIDSESSFTAAKAFTALSLFNILRLPFVVLPMAFSSIFGAIIAFNRFYRFYLTPNHSVCLLPFFPSFPLSLFPSLFLSFPLFSVFIVKRTKREKERENNKGNVMDEKTRQKVKH